MFQRLAAIAVAAALSAGPATAGPGHCPPGLAKKAVPCVPPGLAKKGQTPQPSDLGYTVLSERDWRRLGLRRPADGTRYIQVDSQMLRVQRAAGEVIEAIEAVGDVLNR